MYIILYVSQLISFSSLYSCCCCCYRALYPRFSQSNRFRMMTSVRAIWPRALGKRCQSRAAPRGRFTYQLPNCISTWYRSYDLFTSTFPTSLLPLIPYLILQLLASCSSTHRQTESKENNSSLRDEWSLYILLMLCFSYKKPTADLTFLDCSASVIFDFFFLLFKSLSFVSDSKIVCGSEEDL